jgi:hypothetical protein
MGNLTNALQQLRAERREAQNTLVPPGSNLTLELAENINDRGEISGIGGPPGCGDPFVCGHAFVLMPCDRETADTKDCEDERERTTTATRSNPAPVSYTSTNVTHDRLTPKMLSALRARFARRDRSLGIWPRQ